MAFQEASAVGRAETFFGQSIKRGFGDLDELTLAFHVSLDLGQIEFGDLANFFLCERSKDDDLVDAVAKLGRKTRLGRSHHVTPDLLEIAKRLLAETERRFVF